MEQIEIKCRISSHNHHNPGFSAGCAVGKALVAVSSWFRRVRNDHGRWCCGLQGWGSQEGMALRDELFFIVERSQMGAAGFGNVGSQPAFADGDVSLLLQIA